MYIVSRIEFSKAIRVFSYIHACIHTYIHTYIVSKIEFSKAMGVLSRGLHLGVTNTDCDELFVDMDM
jgi:hypothetical protein